MYHPTTRVLSVLSLLQTHRRMTGTELARRLEVNVRTVRTYITMLQDLGAPITAERGRDGAYELDVGFRLPPMMFSGDEALALVVGLLAAQGMGLGEMAGAIESAQAKLEQAIPDTLKSQTRTLTDTVSLHVNSSPVPSSGEIMLLLSGAAQTQQRVCLRYRSRQGSETERHFDPYGLAYYHGCWYTAGRCHVRHDLRCFRLDRIVWIELTNAHFERPKRFDLLDFVIQGIANLPRKHSFEILLKTDLETARRELIGLSGNLDLCEGGVMLRGSVDDLDWLARQLTRLPCDFTICEPEPLRDAFRNWVARLTNLIE